MFNLLRQPYPSEESVGSQLRKAAIIGLFIGLFLLLFQPFGLNTWNTPQKVIKVMGFGAVTFVVTAFNFIVWQQLFPRQFSDQHWTVGREVLLASGNILVIAIANRLYLEWLLDEGDRSNISWIGMILVTFLVALFPVTGAVLFKYVRQLKKYAQLAADLPVQPPHSSTSVSELLSQTETKTISESADNTMTLVADNEKDVLMLQPDDLLFIESSDNYCTVVHLKDEPVGSGKLLKPLLRSSLSRLETQINRPHIVRCHRSYVVNLNRVERVTGNAQGYKLHLLNGQLQVPVARKYNDTLVTELKSL